MYFSDGLFATFTIFSKIIEYRKYKIDQITFRGERKNDINGSSNRLTFRSVESEALSPKRHLETSAPPLMRRKIKTEKKSIP